MRGGNEWGGLVGNLDQRLKFKNNEEIISPSGEPQDHYVDAFECWGSHRDLRGQERFAMGAEFAQAECTFVIRYENGPPNANQVIEWRNKDYEISAPPIELGNKQGWQVYAKIRRTNV